MKKLSLVALAFIILSQSLLNMAVIAYYEWNKAYIAEKLCINKLKPELKCEGKCYLGKQLKKAEEAEKKQSRHILKQKDEINASTQPLVAGHLMWHKVSEYSTYLTSFIDYPSLTGIDHPPAQV